jgi:hypothetical protein
VDSVLTIRTTLDIQKDLILNSSQILVNFQLASKNPIINVQGCISMFNSTVHLSSPETLPQGSHKIQIFSANCSSYILANVAVDNPKLDQNCEISSTSFVSGGVFITVNCGVSLLVIICSVIGSVVAVVVVAVAVYFIRERNRQKLLSLMQGRLK